MDRKFNVFISSTFSDLRPERMKLIQQVVHLGHTPIAMEYFDAADAKQLDVIKRGIDNSDYYVLVLSDKYGTVAPGGLSYTEEEFDYAQSRKLPTIVFIRDQIAIDNLPAEQRETGNSIARLKAFKDKVIAKRLFARWGDKSDLAKKFSTAFLQLTQQHPQDGWIRQRNVSQIYLKRQEILWPEYNARVRRRFWVAGTSLISVVERGMAGQLAKRGVKDIRLILPATAPCFASFVQLDQYDKLDQLHQEQVEAAARSYTMFWDLKTPGKLDPKKVLRQYGGMMYCNITIFDDDAFLSFYDSVGVGDDNITLHFNRSRNRDGYERATCEFLRMWEASPQVGRITAKSAGAGILFVDESDRVLLFLRDAKTGIPFPNRWDILGGGVEKKETPLECVCREMKEEIGIEVTNATFYSHFNSVGIEQFMFWQIANLDIDKIELNEGQCLKWFSREELNKMSDDTFAFDFGSFLRDFMEKQPWKREEAHASRVA